MSKTEAVLKKAMDIDLKDGFKFFHITKDIMKRETLYGGERFSIEWSLFHRSFQAARVKCPLRIKNQARKCDVIKAKNATVKALSGETSASPRILQRIPFTK